MPIVEGTGSELPGLLGLRSLESARAILDMGAQRLIFPGQGPLTMELPPGTVEVPLQKAPSGHLVMVIDDYDKLIKQSGGLEETGLQLHTAETAQGPTSASSSSAAPVLSAPVPAPAAPPSGPEVAAPVVIHREEPPFIPEKTRCSECGRFLRIVGRYGPGLCLDCAYGTQLTPTPTPAAPASAGGAALMCGAGSSAAQVGEMRGLAVGKGHGAASPE